ncbi:cytochrome c peroxidase [Piscinibacter sp. XHJ-5]|uniref:cytochrome-c peroxidase n=1 Tax=Piscinibacter sp. XHJ-5 TaxID=3037797 RepID=UPI0024534AA4|nr:cytochrome c peroxidase [Piscinibacter sp. XHJ-5]
MGEAGRSRWRRVASAAVVVAAVACAAAMRWGHAHAADNAAGDIDEALAAVLKRAGFTGTVESSLPARLGRPVDSRLADLGRVLFFDSLVSLHDDNSCAGCHAPATGFGDSQSIAIGIQSNQVVGRDRSGPRNQRRTPTVVNSAFYPSLMWNGRFSAPSADPFDNSQGFVFPLPEGTTRFPAFDPVVTHLLIAQAHLPPTELVEVAGFTGTRGTIGPRFDAFDDGLAGKVPPPDASGSRNEPIRQEVLSRLNGSWNYRLRFGELFPAVKAGAPIDFTMFGRAIAEFEFSVVRANAPIDRFARGDRSAMNAAEKRGALVFFGKGRCVSCHAVAGTSNEMFSDFRTHDIGVPQIAPRFGVGLGNVVFDGPGEDEDFGLEQVTGHASDRYRFRTSPLRNVALQPAFFHNGAYTRLEDAIRHHLDVVASARRYDARRAGVSEDLQHRLGPMEPVLAFIDPLLARPIALNRSEFADLVRFVRDGLLDHRAGPRELCTLIPDALPSGRPLLAFEGCEGRR